MKDRVIEGYRDRERNKKSEIKRAALSLRKRKIEKVKVYESERFHRVNV